MRTARVYSDPSDDDGVRILVDRLWPRGVRKDDPRIDEWMPQVAPSKELRQWYGHDADRFAEFRERYAQELSSARISEEVQELVERSRRGTVTLLTATKDLRTSHLPTLARSIRAR